MNTKITLKKIIGHLRTVHLHRKWVRYFCFKFGLYKQGLLHDLSKYGITEFAESAKYFQGNKSPIEARKAAYGYSIAWQHHKGHNPHHWEYWIDNIGTYENKPIMIPQQYVIEMICDWVGAGIVYSGNKPNYNKPYTEPMDYYIAHCNERIFHPVTKREIERLLRIIADDGINAFCKACKGVRDND